jgi:predicted phage baseplate assembly protein
LFIQFLKMMDVTPYVPVAATADLTFLVTSREVPRIVVPGGTPVGTQPAAGKAAVVFTTSKELVIRRSILVACLTHDPKAGVYTDRLPSLSQALDSFKMFDPLQVDAAVLFGFRPSLSRHQIRFDITTSVAGVGIQPSRAPVVWEAWTETGWSPVKVLSDGTGGFNRSGSIVLSLPDGLAGAIFGPARAYWVRVKKVAPEATDDDYRDSPDLLEARVVTEGATVEAAHCEARPVTVLALSSGTPGQEISLGESPVMPPNAEERIEVVDRNGAVTVWEGKEEFSNSGPEDRHVVWSPAAGTIRFGPEIRSPDGTVRTYGAVPPLGSEIRVSGYRVGGGRLGNVPAETLTVPRTTLKFIASVINREPATHGAEGETVEKAKERGPLWVRAGQRAVTRSDYVRIVGEVSPTIARVECVQLRDDADRELGLQVLIIADCGDALQLRRDQLQPSSELMAEIKSDLDEHRMVGTAVELGTPVYVGLSPVVAVERDPAVHPKRVIDDVTKRLLTFLHPLKGGPAATGWTLGSDVVAGAVAGALAEALGVRTVIDVVLFGTRRAGRHDPEQRVGDGTAIFHLDGLELPLVIDPLVVLWDSPKGDRPGKWLYADGEADLPGLGQ